MSASGSSTNVPTAGLKNIVIVGATGMVGGYALRYALDHPAVGRATTIGRRTIQRKVGDRVGSLFAMPVKPALSTTERPQSSGARGAS
jgi:hypothetical protein